MTKIKLHKIIAAFLGLLLFFVVFLALSNILLSKPKIALATTTCTWTNGAGGLQPNGWNTATNWSCGHAPVANTDLVSFDTVNVGGGTLNVPSVTVGDITTTASFTSTLNFSGNVTIDSAGGGTGSFNHVGNSYLQFNSYTLTVWGNLTLRATRADTSTIDLRGATPTVSTTSGTNLYNVKAAYDGQAVTIASAGANKLKVTATLTTQGGSITAADAINGIIELNAVSGVTTALANSGSNTPTFTVGYVLFTAASGVSALNVSQYITTKNTYFQTSNSPSTTYSLTGNMTTGGLKIYSNSAGKKSIVDSNGHNIINSSSRLDVGNSGATTQYGKLIITSGTLTNSAQLTIQASDSTDHNELALAGTNPAINMTGTADDGADWTNSDWFTPGTATVSFTGTGSGSNPTPQLINAGSATSHNGFYNLTLSGSNTRYYVYNNDWNIAGNLTLTAGTLQYFSNTIEIYVGGNLSLSSGTTFTKNTATPGLIFNGSSGQTITDNTAALQDLGSVSSTGSSVSLSTNVKVSTLDIASGTFSIASRTLKVTSVSNNALTNSGTFITTSSTVEYTAGSGSPAITALPYHNLTFTPTAAVTFNQGGNQTATNAITGTLAINTNATFNNNNYGMTALAVTLSGGTWVYTGINNLTLTGGGLTITSGTANLSSFHNTGSITGNIINGGTLNLSSGFSGSTLTASGNFTNTGTTNLTSSQAGLTIGGNLNNQGTITLTSSSSPIHVVGTWTDSGTINGSSGGTAATNIITIDGASYTHSNSNLTPGATKFHFTGNVTINSGGDTTGKRFNSIQFADDGTIATFASAITAIGQVTTGSGFVKTSIGSAAVFTLTGSSLSGYATPYQTDANDPAEWDLATQVVFMPISTINIPRSNFYLLYFTANGGDQIFNLTGDLVLGNSLSIYGINTGLQSIVHTNGYDITSYGDLLVGNLGDPTKYGKLIIDGGTQSVVTVSRTFIISNGQDGTTPLESIDTDPNVTATCSTPNNILDIQQADALVKVNFRWINNCVFTSNDMGTVILSGNEYGKIYGTSSFNNLTINTSNAAIDGAKTVLSQPDKTQTITGTLDLGGGYYRPQTLGPTSSSGSGQWTWDIPANITTPIRYTAVTNGILANSKTAKLGLGSSLAGTNVGWFLNTPPANPASLGPIQYINGTSWTSISQPTLQFTLADSDAGEQVQYQIQISANADFSDPVVDYTSVLDTPNSTSFTVGQNADSGTYTIGSAGQILAENTDGGYYWRVRNIDSEESASDYVAGSSSRSIKVDTTAPTITNAPFVYSPTANPLPSWIWTDATDALSQLSKYYIKVGTSSGGSNILAETAIGNVLTWAPTTPLTDGTYYLSLKAEDYAGNQSSYSTSNSVKIQIASPTNIVTKSNTIANQDVKLSVADVSNHASKQIHTFLSWTKLAKINDTTVNQYSILRNNQQINTVNSAEINYYLDSPTTIEKYIYSVNALDSLGNILANYPKTEIDLTASVKTAKITNLTVLAGQKDGMLSDTAQISWTSNTPTINEIVFGDSTTLTDKSNLETFYGYTHKINITKLTKGVNYHWKIISKDSDGNIVKSNEEIFNLGESETTFWQNVEQYLINPFVKLKNIFNSTLKKPVDENITYNPSIIYDLSAVNNQSAIATIIPNNNSLTWSNDGLKFNSVDHGALDYVLLNNLTQGQTYNFKNETNDVLNLQLGKNTN